jgi:hypothetical protein
VIGTAFGVFIPLLWHEREPADGPASAPLRQQLPLLAIAF